MRKGAVCRTSHKRILHPNLIRLNKREYLFVFERVHIPDNQELLLTFNQPRQELAEERKRRIGDDDVGFVAEFLHLVGTEVAVAFEIVPFQVLDVNAAVPVGVVVEDEDFAADARLLLVELRRGGFKERRL